MNQEMFIVTSDYYLRGLPGWLAKRSYNTVKHGLKDKKGHALVGLQERVGDFTTKAGIICITDDAIVDRVIEICRQCCRSKPLVVGLDENKHEPNEDPRTEFMRTLAANENLLPDKAAFSVTCAQFGLSYDAGMRMVNTNERKMG